MSGGQLAVLRIAASMADAGDMQLGDELARLARLARQHAQLVMITVAEGDAVLALIAISPAPAS